MLIFYLIQDLVQNFYDSIEKFGQQRLIFKIILFFFKTIYVNMISFASLLQYRSYWDFYNGLISFIRSFLLFPLFCFLMYRTASVILSRFCGNSNPCISAQPHSEKFSALLASPTRRIFRGVFARQGETNIVSFNYYSAF